MAEGEGMGLVRRLLDEGGAEQLRAKDNSGELPIHRAARDSSSAEVVALLLERGGAEQLRAKDNSGELPIHLAARDSSSAEVVALLASALGTRGVWAVRSGPWQLSAKNRQGRTPLAVAELQHRPEAIQALLRPPRRSELLGFEPPPPAVSQPAAVQSRSQSRAQQAQRRATRPARPQATLLKLRKSPELKKEEARQKRKIKRINDREQEQLLMDEEWLKLNVYGL
jgi:hypothetical protein